MSLIMTYKCIVTLDTSKKMRIFPLNHLESENEILVPMKTQELNGTGNIVTIQSIPNQLFVVSVKNDQFENFPSVQIKFLDFM